MISRTALIVAGLAGVLGAASAAAAQDVRIRDLAIGDQAVPIRLVGYGLVVGLDGSGDRALGGRSAGHTVQSVTNLLRRFDIEVPAEYLRTRNVAAVLVTAEVSPYLRPGGRFEVHVSSLGDARSLRGGVLWLTPLVSDIGELPVATGQGSLVLRDDALRRGFGGEATGRIPAGGMLESDLPRPGPGLAGHRILLREPDLVTAARIAAAVNEAFGEGSARVEDPGAVALNLNGQDDAAGQLAAIGELRVQPARASRLVIDIRDGTVVAGGDLRVGEAVVSHNGITLAIGGAVDEEGGFGTDLRMTEGATVQDVAAALHAVRAPAREIAAIFQALQHVGALPAEVVIR